MSATSRATIPQEFLDLTSADLLRQPIPSFFHAMLIMNALRARVDFSAPWGLPIPGREFGGEGAPPYAQLKDEMTQLSPEPDMVYADAIKVVPEFGKRVGHTIRINRPKFTSSTATRAARRIPGGTTISKTPIPVLSEQAQVTIERFAGPYDDVSGQVQPFGIERFDAERMIHDPASIKDLHLTFDFHHAVDTWGVQLFDQADPSTGILYPAGMTADNDSVTPGDFPMSYELLSRVEESLASANIPRFSNGRYMYVASPRQMQQLNVDPMFERLSQFHRDINPVLAPAYRKTVGTLDIFESTTLSKPLNSSSVPIHYGQAFGPEAIGWGVGEMPRVAPDSDDNYGETAKVIWLWYCGFDVLDSRFLRSVRTS